MTKREFIGMLDSFDDDAKINFFVTDKGYPSGSASSMKLVWTQTPEGQSIGVCLQDFKGLDEIVESHK